MRRLGGGLLLAALAASGQWRAAAFIVPSATNRVALSWSPLGSGARYYVQTTTDLLTWTAATNTLATNVNLAFTGDKMRAFRLSASGAPPQSVTVAWDPASPSTGITSYSLYYGVSTGSYTNVLEVGLATTAVVPNLVVGTTYYFAATSHSSSGAESAFSNEAVWQGSLLLKIQELP